MANFLLDSISKCASALPLPGTMAFGRFLGVIYGSLIRYHRKDAEQALQLSLPEKSKKERDEIIANMYKNLGMGIAESMLVAAGRAEELVRKINVIGEEYVVEARKRNKGVLILTAHYGNWDLLSVSTALNGYPLTIISKDIKNKWINKYWMDLRRQYGLKLVPAHNSYRLCRAALKNNELVGFILDQNMIRDEGVFVDFFGRPACTTPGLAYLSAQSEAPVVPVFIRRLPDNKHEVNVLPIIEPPPNREPDTILKATQHYTQIIEEQIKKQPDQWIWIHRRWKTQPPTM